MFYYKNNQGNIYLLNISLYDAQMIAQDKSGYQENIYNYTLVMGIFECLHLPVKLPPPQPLAEFNQSCYTAYLRGKGIIFLSVHLSVKLSPPRTLGGN